MVTQEQKKHSTEMASINKAIRGYIRKIEDVEGVQELTYSEFFENKMLIIRVIRKGLPYALFSKIKDLTPFT